MVLNPGGRSGRSGLKGLGLKPYRGKLTVRNFRGGAGNAATGAGLRPASKAADEPPDPKVGAPALYPAGLPGSWRTLRERVLLSDPGGIALARPLRRCDAAFRQVNTVGSRDDVDFGAQ